MPALEQIPRKSNLCRNVFGIFKTEEKLTQFRNYASGKPILFICQRGIFWLGQVIRLCPSPVEKLRLPRYVAYEPALRSF